MYGSHVTAYGSLLLTFTISIIDNLEKQILLLQKKKLHRSSSDVLNHNTVESLKFEVFGTRNVKNIRIISGSNYPIKYITPN